MSERALIRPAFISEQERQALLAHAMTLKAQGVLEQNPGGPLRYRAKVHGSEHCTETMFAVAERIRGTFGIEGSAVDPNLGWIISWIEPGGFIKTHIDAHQNYQRSGELHLRCNVLVQGSDATCHPVIDHIAHPVNEGDLWAFVASRYPHGTQVIAGGQARVVYQFGFVVPAEFELS